MSHRVPHAWDHSTLENSLPFVEARCTRDFPRVLFKKVETFLRGTVRCRRIVNSLPFVEREDETRFNILFIVTDVEANK